MKPEALGGLTGLGTQPGRTFTQQPENAEPTQTRTSTDTRRPRLSSLLEDSSQEQPDVATR